MNHRLSPGFLDTIFLLSPKPHNNSYTNFIIATHPSNTHTNLSSPDMACQWSFTAQIIPKQHPGHANGLLHAKGFPQQNSSLANSGGIG